MLFVMKETGGDLMFPPALIIYSFADDAIVLFCDVALLCAITNGGLGGGEEGIEINSPSAFDLLWG